MALFKKASEPLVGIDISSNSVKLIELVETQSGYEVASYGVELLPPGVVQKGDVKDPMQVGEAIARLVRRSRTKAKNAAISVSGTSAITKVIQLNKDLSEDEMESQIALETDEYIPYPLDEISWDFAVLGASEHNPNNVDVLLAACRSETIESRVDALEIAGLNAKVVDLEIYAMERACSQIFEKLNMATEEKLIAIIDIGSLSTSVTIMKDDRVLYTREQDFGGNQLLLDIQEHYGLTMEEAIIAKRQNEFPEGYEENILQPFLNSIVTKIERALQFFYSSTQYNHVDYILLAGGTSAISGLSEKIKQHLQCSASVANPFANMKLAPHISAEGIHREAPALMLSCGLAMRAFD